MSQESTGIHWLLSDTNFILSSKKDNSILRPINILNLLSNRDYYNHDYILPCFM